MLQDTQPQQKEFYFVSFRLRADEMPLLRQLTELHDRNQSSLLRHLVKQEARRCGLLPPVQTQTKGDAPDEHA